MTAKEYLEQLFMSRNIDWLGMLGDNNNIMVTFLGSPANIHEQLKPLEQSKDIVDFGIMRSVGSRCTAMIYLNPHKLEEPTLTEAFAMLVKSTSDFHERAETRKHSNLQDARAVMDEEYAEVWAELTGVIAFKRHPGDLTKELADLLVTMLGVALFAGISEDDLAAGMLQVAAKNDAKTDENCVWHNGKYTRREKLLLDDDELV